MLVGMVIRVLRVPGALNVLSVMFVISVVNVVAVIHMRGTISAASRSISSMSAILSGVHITSVLILVICPCQC